VGPVVDPDVVAGNPSDLRGKCRVAFLAITVQGRPVHERRHQRDQRAMKRPQARQDQPQVVTRPAHHRMQRVAQFSLEPVSIEQTVGLHVPDHGLDHLAALQHPLKAWRQPSGVAQDQPGLGPLGRHAAVAAIGQHRRGRRVGEDLHLFERVGQCVPVVGIARHRSHADHQAFLRSHRDRHLHAELVRRSGLPLGDALHLGGVQRVDLAGVLAALRIQPARDCELLGQHHRQRLTCLTCLGS
jgi:hypothetical protein